MTFVEFLTFRNVRWRRASGAEIWVQCPWCGDTELRYGLNLEKNIGHCFRGTCGVKHRNAKKWFLIQIKAGNARISDNSFEEESKIEKIELPEGFFLLREVRRKDDPLLYEPKKYLLDRGVTSQQIRDHFIGATLSGRFRYRIVIPVHYEKRLLGIVARDYTGMNEPKYLNSRGEKAVYNLRKAAQGETLVLTEGCFKALAIERAAPAFASSALLGHSITDLQVDQITDAGFRNILLFSDPDEAGARGTYKVASRLADDRFSVRLCFPVPHKQADELSDAQIRHYLQTARPWTITLARRMKRSL